MGVDCTFIYMGQSIKFSSKVKGAPLCLPPSCLSDWESGKDQLLADADADEMVKEMEIMFSEALAAEGISIDPECKMNSFSISSAGGKATGMLALAATFAAAALFFF